MNKVVHLIAISLLAISLSGCDESIWAGASNKNTSQAITDEIDFAFITGDCQKVVSYYDNIKAHGGSLNSREANMYSNALLACSGFDLVSGIDKILGSGDTSDIYGTISSIMGTSNVDKGTVDKLKDQYDKVLDNCNSFNPLPESMVTTCGLAATSSTVADLADILLGTGVTSNIELTQAGMNKVIEDAKKHGTSITNSVDSFVSDPSALENLNKNIEYIEKVSSVVGGSGGGFDEIVSQIKDSKTGKVTAESLKDFINNKLGK